MFVERLFFWQAKQCTDWFGLDDFLNKIWMNLIWIDVVWIALGDSVINKSKVMYYKLELKNRFESEQWWKIFFEKCYD